LRFEYPAAVWHVICNTPAVMGDPIMAQVRKI
jgi:hypothetical protein